MTLRLDVEAVDGAARATTVTTARGSFSTPFKRTSGAVISRLSRCLRSTLGVRRSAKVAMVHTSQEPKARNGPYQKQERA